KAIEGALDRVSALPEWIDPGLRERRSWPHWEEAVHQAHTPGAEADLLPTTPARERLAYDEILASQLAVAVVRARRHRQKGRAILGTGALTGRVEAPLGFALTGAQRLASLASGLTPVVVGTHALLQPDVEFRDLALVVIDEQHRFGVEQRLGLYAKGRDADTLLMSATPIPRTLMMTAYGDLDVSRLTEKPPGRHPVDTRTVALEIGRAHV